MPLDEWQDVALEAAMGERADGRWASKFVGISAPRQNGKSQLIVARALAGVLLFGERMIIISAHETDTAREVWKRLIEVIEDNPTLEDRVTGRMDAINREFISFGEGKARQTIRLKARGKSGVRGFSADCLLLDEGQILGKSAWGSIVPTMSARGKATSGGPQLWLFGTPPTEDDVPFAFSRVRESAKAGKARHTWLEWAAEPTDDFDAPATWAKANPSFGVRLTEEACADDRAAMDDEQFAVERLGIWPDRLAEVPDVFGPGAWAACRAPFDAEVELASVGVAAQTDMSRASIVGAASVGERVQVRPLFSGPRLESLVEAAKALQDDTGCAVVVDAGGPAGVLVPMLESVGVTVTKPTAAEFFHANASALDLVRGGKLAHDSYDELDKQVAGAQSRTGDKFVLDRKKSAVDVVEAMFLATWGVSRPQEAAPTSVYETRGVLTI